MNAAADIDRAREISDAKQIDDLCYTDAEMAQWEAFEKEALSDPAMAYEEVSERPDFASVANDVLIDALYSRLSLMGLSLYSAPTAEMIGHTIDQWRNDLAGKYADEMMRRERES